MLSRKKMRTIGLNACIEKIGSEFYDKNKGFSCTAFGKVPDGEFCFVGVDTKDSQLVCSKKELRVGGVTPISYRVSCVVHPSGKIEFLESVLPTLL